VRIVIVGDTHGTRGVYQARRIALTEGVGHVVQCGDVWAVNAQPDTNTTLLETAFLHVIQGNHEKWELWDRDYFGPKIIGHLDYSVFELGGKKFGVIGRIDDIPEVRRLMADGLFLGEPLDRIFFERKTMEQVKTLLGGCDVLLFHDAPRPFVLGHRPVPDAPPGEWIGAGPVSDPLIIGSDYLAAVVRTIKPKLVFHGHMHITDIRHIGWTHVYGLPPIDPRFRDRGYAVLDTKTMTVTYKELQR
jgi:predicted phosphodiesterase